MPGIHFAGTITQAGVPQGWDRYVGPFGAVVGVALGSFRPETAELYFQMQKLPVVKVRTYSLYAFGNASGPGDLFFFFIDSNTAAFGQRRELERLIAVRHGEAEGLLSNTQL